MPQYSKDNRFDLINEELVRNRAMLIEASAGTGKTYSLERLVARLIVEENVPIQSLLIMTFTRAATAELSFRIRKILMVFRHDLNQMTFPDLVSPDDSRLMEIDKDEVNRKLLVKWLNGQKPVPRQTCIDRLSDALNHFDDAAVFTIHAFCQKMLMDYVFSRGGSFEMTVGEDDGQVAQALDEALRTTYASRKKDEAFIRELQNWQNWEEKIGKLKSQPMSEVELTVRSAKEESADVSPDMKAWIQQIFRLIPDRIRVLKRIAKTLTFDDLLLELWLALKGNPVLVDNIRKRFRAVLVDEFQDTDPIQFNILEKLFLPEPGVENREQGQYAFFVGDPKQAIYGFRSAELETYLQARDTIGYTKVLDRNFRSTPALVHVVNTFFEQQVEPQNGKGRSRFLNEGIPYEHVGFDKSKLPLMRKTSDGRFWEPVPAFELWTNTFTEDTKFTEKQIDGWLAKAVATDIAGLLQPEDGRTVYCRVEGEPKEPKKLEPKDIAILVKQRADADQVVRELASRGIRTRLNSNERVFQSTEAIEVLALLDAMIAPDRLDVVTAARATRLVGHTLETIQDNEPELQAFRDFVKEASPRIEKTGIYPVFMDLMRRYETSKRLLPLLKGARILANYQHILELMQVAQQEQGDLMGITHWLRKAIADEQGISDDDVLKLRIESDDNLVNIVTIHASKGLEYPVVYLLDAVRTRVNIRQRRSIFRETDTDGKKRYLLTDQPMPVSRHFQTYQREEQELIRLAYVGMTRASKRLVLPLVLGVPPNATKDFSKFSTDSIASAYVRALYAEPMAYADEKSAKKRQATDRNQMGLKVQVESWWHGRLEPVFQEQEKEKYSSDEVKKTSLNTVIGVLEALFSADVGDKTKDVEAYQSLADIPLRALRVDDFYQWKHVGSQDDDKEIPLDGNRLERISSGYETDSANEMLKTWGRTSFSDISRKLDTKKSFTGENNDFASFPKGTVPGDFLHKLIEKAINERFSVKDASDTAFRAFIADQMKGKSFFAGKTDMKYQPVCLKRLGYQEQETPSSFAEYCQKWIENCLRILLTKPIAVAGTETVIDIGGLVRLHQVVSEIDFMLKASGKQDQGWDIGSIIKGLTGLSLEANPSVAEESLKGYLVGQIDLLLKNTDGRYWVIDWKSNAIDTENACDNPANYTQEAMEAVMDVHHYKLQALCYTVALFRYLQQRHPGVSSEKILEMIGGAVYVFLRGIDEIDGNLGIYCMPIEMIKDNVIALDNVLSGQAVRD